MFQSAEIIISNIEKDCEKTGAELRAGLDALKNVSCTADIDGKADVFKDAYEALANGRKNCPDHEKDFDALDELLVMAQGVKCSGG